jgi:hypothetical protein
LSKRESIEITFRSRVTSTYFDKNENKENLIKNYKEMKFANRFISRCF